MISPAGAMLLRKPKLLNLRPIGRRKKRLSRPGSNGRKNELGLPPPETCGEQSGIKQSKKNKRE